MKIIVGSTNPAKVNAVKRVAEQLFDEVEVNGLKTNSGVSDMPMSEQETMTGSINRARIASNQGDFGIGIEGGVSDTKQGMFLFAWITIINKNKISLSCTNKILLPENIASELRNGRELGPLIDELTGQEKVSHSEGAFGLLTKGSISRVKSFENAVYCAFMKFINKEYC